MKGRRGGNNHACPAACDYEAKVIDEDASDEEILNALVFTGQGLWDKEEETSKIEKAQLNPDSKEWIKKLFNRGKSQSQFSTF